MAVGVNGCVGEAMDESVSVERTVGVGVTAKVAVLAGKACADGTDAIMEKAVEAVALTEDTTCVKTSISARGTATIPRAASALLR